MEHLLTLHLSSPQHSQELGARLGRALQSGDVLAFSGPLGAGKTTLIRGIGAGWGAEQAITSPTFVIVHRYTRPHDSQTLHHLDAYRLSGPAEAEAIGWADILAAEGACLIEWAENIRAALPTELLWLTLDYHPQDDSARILQARAIGERPAALLKILEEGA